MSKKIKLYKCRAYMFCNYELLEKNSIKIGKECRVDSHTIRNWLKKFNIRIRTNSESKIGKNSSQWKGDEVKITGLHHWIATYKPKSVDGKCSICHEISDKKGDDVLELSNIKNHQYKRNIDDYQWVHHSCHAGYDKEKRRAKSKMTKISKENKYLSQVGYWLRN